VVVGKFISPTSKFLLTKGGGGKYQPTKQQWGRGGVGVRSTSR